MFTYIKRSPYLYAETTVFQTSYGSAKLCTYKLQNINTRYVGHLYTTNYKPPIIEM